MAIEDDVSRYESLMERMFNAYRARIVAVCRDADLTPPQFWALKQIQQMDQTKMSPLADCLGLSLGAASTLVDRLVTRGLVERTTDAQDRRAVHVSPSEKGEQVLHGVLDSKNAMTRAVFSTMPAELREQLLTGLEGLIAAWDKLPVTPVEQPGPLSE